MGGDAALFLVMTHEHGHVLDMYNHTEHDIEGTANAHAIQMEAWASRPMKNERGW